MENIIMPNKSFDFTKLTLGHPVSIQGGAYFTKIEFNQKPLYIQTTKSVTKQGILKSGKKNYCDLMFSYSSGDFINWFELLEERCQDLIFDKKDSWFQSSLDKNDIETAFNSIIKIYKSGKYYLLRTFIKNSQSSNINLNIYNESLLPLSIENINNENEIISILEIQGIKFTSRNFQVEICLKQVMVLDKEPIFENCLIQTNKNNLYKNPIINLEKKIDLVDESNNLELTYINQESNSLLVNDNTEIDQNQSNEYSQNDSIHLEKVEEEIIIGNKEKKIMNKSLEKIDDPEITLDIEDLENNVDRYKTDFKEISIDSNLDNNSNDNLEEITLRKPNRIYFELYKKARDKAKQAKKEAILAYLEAKNIKNTYMIDNLNDEDYSTLDDEIDDVSESELENLER
jgi:hypothetical protein